MADDEHELPVAEVYRNVEIYGLQDAARIARAKLEIDQVFKMRSAAALAAFAMDHGRAPEARLLAKTKALAATEERQKRAFDRDRLVACCAGIERRETVLGRLMGYRMADGAWPDEWCPV